MDYLPSAPHSSPCTITRIPSVVPPTDFLFRTGILRLYHQDWNFVTVKTGDILFSNDGFGQHYASETLFNDAVDQAELCQKYGSDFAEAGK